MDKPVARYAQVAILFSVAVLSVACGIFGMWVGFNDIFKEDVSLQKTASIILSIVGVIATTLGADYLVLHSEFLSHLRRTEGLLKSSLDGRFLRSRTEVYAVAAAAVLTAKRSIRTVVSDKAPKATQEFFDALIERLQQSKRAENKVIYEVTFVVDTKSVTDDWIADVQERWTHFKKHRVENQVIRRIVDSKGIGIDVLIVDDAYVNFAFSRTAEGGDRENAFSIDDNPELGACLLAWFTNRIKGEDFDAWVKSRRSSQDPAATPPRPQHTGHL